jgi:hypothetical protein
MASLLEELVGGGEPDYSRPSTSPLRDLVDMPEVDEGFGLMDALGLLGRPQMAMGEAIGAARAGEDVLEAGLQGLMGETRYGTLGEQLFPGEGIEDPGDKFLNSVAQMGVDFVADPMWLLWGPAVRGVGGAMKGAG